MTVFLGMISPGSFLPLFPSLVDLPILAVALEKVERSSGSLIGNSIASIQKSTAPEMLFALTDEAYTGSTIEDRGGNGQAESSRQRTKLGRAGTDRDLSWCAHSQALTFLLAKQHEIVNILDFHSMLNQQNVAIPSSPFECVIQNWCAQNRDAILDE